MSKFVNTFEYVLIYRYLPGAKRKTKTRRKNQDFVFEIVFFVLHILIMVMIVSTSFAQGSRIACVLPSFAKFEERTVSERALPGPYINLSDSTGPYVHI